MTGSGAPPGATSPGSIALIGGGPGDIDLLTLRAVERLRTADVILYDDLAGDEILSFARADAELVAVGKRAGHPAKVFPMDRVFAAAILQAFHVRSQFQRRMRQ